MKRRYQIVFLVSLWIALTAGAVQYTKHRLGAQFVEAFP